MSSSNGTKGFPKMITFAKALRMARQETNMTQDDVAKASEMDESYVRKIEKDQVPPPSREKVIALARALGSSALDEQAFLTLAGYLHSRFQPLFWHYTYLVIGLLESLDIGSLPKNQLDFLERAALKGRDRFVWGEVDPPKSYVENYGEYAYFHWLLEAMKKVDRNLKAKIRARRN